LKPRGRVGRLLDFGCGAGDFLAHAGEAGWEAVGYEPGVRGREACLAQGLKIVGRLEELQPGEFHVITLNHVFEHLANHGATLNTLRDLLAPGGHVYLEVPNARSLRARLSFPLLSQRFGFDERYRAFPIHLTYFDGWTLPRLLERYDFQVEVVATNGFGFDELLVRPERMRRNAPAARIGTPRPLRGLLHRLARGIILDRGLGENLGVICCPRRGSN
jgi:SAM-dependent methyltransferase